MGLIEYSCYGLGRNYKNRHSREYGNLFWPWDY